ncbi:neuropeptide FF receptor 2-like [Stylophora pistillata]|uniref:neuropeptide FF receptor 2-like n=1 Tax=Stylophora pistillata TaxID=50429 RepID=UPI000C03C3AD|nr:neuropeptide FF receptor 2-like [Stylophora pistillata]
MSNAANATNLFCGADTSTLSLVAQVSLYVIVMLVSLIGNSLVFAVVLKNRRMRTPVNFFVINMAAADILITVFYMPRMISRIFLGSEWGISGGLGHFLCKIAPITQELSASVSVLTLIVMAVDRFFAVLFPLKRIITNLVAKASIALVWIIAAAVRSPMFYALRLTQREDGKTFCVLQMESQTASDFYSKFAFVLFYVIPLFVLTVLYSAILVTLKKQKLVGEDLTNTQKRYKNRLKRTRKVMNMVFTIVFVFAFGWCLHFFFPILSNRYGLKVCKLVFPAFFLGHATSAINPCIYLIFIENYRRGFREILNPLCLTCFNRVILNSRVGTQDCTDFTVRRRESHNESLTLGTLDCERTVRSRTVQVLPASTS